MNLSKLQEIVKDRGTWCAAVRGVIVRQDLATEQGEGSLLKQFERIEKQSKREAELFFLLQSFSSTLITEPSRSLGCRSRSVTERKLFCNQN